LLVKIWKKIVYRSHHDRYILLRAVRCRTHYEGRPTSFSYQLNITFKFILTGFNYFVLIFMLTSSPFNDTVISYVYRFFHNVGLPLDHGHLWPKHVRQKYFTDLINKIVTVDGILLLI
jgi:hypothetical protein